MERHSSMSNIPDSDDGNKDKGRSLQRHATTDLSFFTPSSLSFNPKPYFPHTGNAPVRTKSTPSSSSLQREPSSSALQLQKSLDVSYNDPDAIFIRYPFMSFPDAHLYPDGLTYNLMADRPNWFLDPADFKTENDTDPNRIPYPQILEPPRGWCPLKKKDVKEKGPEAFNSDDAPKLRCTFCRRGYAGVNAKSMWRRHVLEKHKIPMSNRRDGPNEGGSRGRSSSNKENKRSVSSSSIPVKKDPFTVQSFFKAKSKETDSAAVPALKGLSENRSARNFNTRSQSPPAAIPDEIITSSAHPAEAPANSRPSEPEFVPDDDAKSRSSRSPNLSSLMLPPSSPLDEGMSHLAWLDLSPSRASPMRTPNLYKKRNRFRMPWKFPSPSHPLYNAPDELCLGVPIGGMTGEGLRSSYVALQASPFPGTAGNQSQFSSPVAASPLSRKPVTGRVLGWKKPKDILKSKLLPLPEPSPRRPTYTGPLPVPMSDNLQMTPTPDLTFSTDSDADHSFSTLGEPFTTEAFANWFELSSPEKGKKDLSASGFPDTPLRRSASKTSIEKLQLVTPDKEKNAEKEKSSSTLLPSGFGLGFNFKINLSTLGAKRARSEEPDDHDSQASDDFGELLYPSTEEPSVSTQKNITKVSRHKGKSLSLSSLLGESSSTERDDEPPTEVDSDHDSIFGDIIPMKKRRLLV